MEPDDAELVNRSQQGHLAAFNLIVERYRSQVFNLVTRMVGNRASGEDVTQEAFLSAYRGIGRFRGGSLRAWPLRIASNASRDVIRASRRRGPSNLWTSPWETRASRCPPTRSPPNSTCSEGSWVT